MLDCVGEVLSHFEVCQAFAEAPRLLIAGARRRRPLMRSFKWVLLGNPNALNATEIYPKRPLLAQVRSKNPSDAWDAFSVPRIEVFGRPKTSQMDTEGD